METPPTENSFRPPHLSTFFRNVHSLRLLNALNSEDRGLKVGFSLAMIVFETFELILCQMLSSQGKNGPSNPYPHYLVRLATSRFVRDKFLHRGFCTSETRIWARILGNEFLGPEFWTRKSRLEFFEPVFSCK